MAGNVGNTKANAILDSIWGSGNPATLYFAAMTTSAGNAGGGAEVSTGVWTDYAPVAKTNNATNFPAASSRTKANGTVITFTAAAVIVGTAPVIAGVAVYDHATLRTEVHLVAWYALAVPQTINNGNPVSIAIGAFGALVAA